MSCSVSAAWHSCVAAHWSKYHCYKQEPSRYDLRCLKATLNLNKQTTRKYSIAVESHIRSHYRISSKIQLFCKHIEITLNIILYEFIVSRVGYMGILPNHSLGNT